MISGIVFYEEDGGIGMKKEVYQGTELEIIMFETEDIITESPLPQTLGGDGGAETEAYAP